jgi:hypothetical protein
MLTIILGGSADSVEKYAAEELKKYVGLLYGFTAEILTGPCPKVAGASVFIGHDHDNPLVSGCTKGVSWEVLSSDGFVLKTIQVDSDVLLVAGGSGRGTLFGVYELLERWGARFLLSDDLLPEKPRPFRLTGFDETVNPAYSIRAIRPMANVPEGAAPWDLSDFTDFIDRMARLKYNAFVFVVQESGPWLDYEFRGMKRPAGDIFYGYRIPIDDDFVGNELFGGKREFYNPILAKAQNEEERKKYGIELVRAIIRHCKLRGLMSIMVFTLLEPPTAFKHQCNEWASLPLPDPKLFAGSIFTVTPTEEFGINPQYAAWMNVMDPTVQELTSHRLKCLINTYPDADYYHLWVSEHRATVVDHNHIFRLLDDKYQLSPEFDWDKVFDDYTSSPFDRNRYQDQMKGDLLFLYVLDKILNEDKLLNQTVKPNAAIGIAGVMPQLAPIVTRLLPDNATFVQFLDYGSHGPADRIGRMAPLLQAGVPTTLEIGLHDDNNMYFPQAAVESLEKIVKATAPMNMLGYVVAIWQVRQSDIGAAYLGRASWEPNLTASEFYKDFLPRLVGPAAAEDFEHAHRMIEVVDRQVRGGITYGYAFLLTSKLIKAFMQYGVDRNAIADIRRQFLSALEALRAARAKGPARAPYVEFWIKRTQFAIEWMDMVCMCDDLGQIVGREYQLGMPLSPEQRRNALSTFDEILSRLRSLIELIASDAGHIGDLGQIANINQHAYRHLRELRAAIEGQ